MKKLILILGLFVSINVFGQTPVPGDPLKQYIDYYLPNNTSKQISPYDLRTVLYEMSDSTIVDYSILGAEDTTTLTGVQGQLLYAIHERVFYYFDGDYWQELTTGGGDGKWTDTPTGDNIYYSDSVGIGTNAPTEILDVHGNMWITGEIDGPYIDHAATDNIYFGESLEMSDSTFIQIERVAGENTTINTIGYQFTDGSVYTCIADVDSTINPQYLILKSVSVGQPLSVAIPNSLINQSGWTWTIGEPVYISATTGLLTQTPPTSTGQWICEVGYATSTTSIYFNPKKPIKIL